MRKKRPAPAVLADPPRTQAALMNHYTRCTVATSADNEALLALSDAVKMRAGRLGIGYSRRPDYFAANRDSGARSFAVALHNADGSITGTTSLIVRDALLGGVPVRYGYLCDLRTLPKMERKTWLEFVRYYAEAIRYVPQIGEAGSPQFFLTAVIDANERALRLLRNRLPGITYQALERYQVVQAFFRYRPSFIRTDKTLARRGISLRQAAAVDANAIARFLGEHNHSASLGEAIGTPWADELERRLATWENSSWSSFWIAESAQGEVVGCVSPRECKHKRAVLNGLSWWQRLFAWTVRIFGARHVKNDEPLDMVYMSHFAVAKALDQKTRTLLLRALLSRCFAERTRLRAHAVCWLEWMRFAESRVPAGGFACVRTQGTLYQVLLREDVGSHADLSQEKFTAAPVLDVSTL